MSKGGNNPDYFNDEAKRSLVADFVVQFYNRSIKLDLAEKDLGGSALSYVMEKEAFRKLKNVEIVSYYVEEKQRYLSTYSPYDVFHVIKRDPRFLDLEELADKYSNVVKVGPEEKEAVIDKIYETIMVMLREGRMSDNFRLKPYRDAQIEGLTAQIARLTKLIDSLEKRLKGVENNPILKTGITR